MECLLFLHFTITKSK